MKTLAIAATLALAGLTQMSGSADASGYGHRGHGYGHGHYGYGYGYGHGHGYGQYCEWRRVRYHGHYRWVRFCR